MDFENNTPIYLQLQDIILVKIATKQWEKGSKLPSVRELALQFKVNPNTAQRALSELEREGFVYTERTSGRFVTQNEALIIELHQKLTHKELEAFIQQMKPLGYEERTLVECLESYIRRKKE